MTDDIFVSNAVLPDEADTLSWEPVIFTDTNGNEVEEERPMTLPLNDEAIPQLAKKLSEALWALSTFVRDARSTRRPLQHFLVRAFLDDGIDEFLAHLITIEAALGLPEDHFPRVRQQLRGRKKNNPGASDRLKWRVGGLLDDREACKTFERLYKRRSDFIHGKQMDRIGGSEKVDARRLARRCVSAILKHIESSAEAFSYEEFLQKLLLFGHQLEADVA